MSRENSRNSSDTQLNQLEHDQSVSPVEEQPSQPVMPTHSRVTARRVSSTFFFYSSKLEFIELIFKKSKKGCSTLIIPASDTAMFEALAMRMGGEVIIEK